MRIVNFILLLIITLSGCKKYVCPEPKHRVFLFDAYDKNRIAFTSIDTLIFMENNTGDTSILINQGYKLAFDLQFGLGTLDCGYGTDSFESRTYNYMPVKGPMKAMVRFTKNDYDGKLDFDVNGNQFKIDYSYYSRSFDSIVINTKTYYMVHVYNSTEYANGSLYYSSSHGILLVSIPGYFWGRL